MSEIKYATRDPYVYCPECQATFRTDPMDATCRLCNKFFREMEKSESPLLFEISAAQEEIAALKKENSGLRSVTIAHLKEPMPGWSQKVWDLNQEIAALKSTLSKAREEFRTILHSDTCLPKDIALKTIAGIDAVLKGELK